MNPMIYGLPYFARHTQIYQSCKLELASRPTPVIASSTRSLKEQRGEH